MSSINIEFCLIKLRTETTDNKNVKVKFNFLTKATINESGVYIKQYCKK